MKRKTINQVNTIDRQAVVEAQRETIGREGNIAMTETGDNRAQTGITIGRDNPIGETKAEVQGEIITIEAGTTARGGTVGETDFTRTTETDSLVETDSPAETGTEAQAQITCTKETAETTDKISIRTGA